MSKYSPLESYLKNKDGNEVSLSFQRIEKILGDSLPQSAIKYRPWWANEKEGRHVQAHSWMNAGWKVESVSLTRKIVKFVKIKKIRTRGQPIFF